MVKMASCALPVCTAAIALLISQPAQSEVYPYSENFRGDATYYGHTTRGNCAIREPIPRMYDGMIPVALNAPQVSRLALCVLIACIGSCCQAENSSGRSATLRVV